MFQAFARHAITTQIAIARQTLSRKAGDESKAKYAAARNMNAVMRDDITIGSPPPQPMYQVRFNATAAIHQVTNEEFSDLVQSSFASAIARTRSNVTRTQWTGVSGGKM